MKDNRKNRARRVKQGIGVVDNGQFVEGTAVP